MANWCQNRLAWSGDEEQIELFLDHLFKLKAIYKEQYGISTKNPSPDALVSPNALEEFCSKHPLRIEKDVWFLDDIDLIKGEKYPLDYIDFQTKWGIEYDDVKGLSETYPDVTFRISYSEAGSDFGGYAIFLNGEVEASEKGGADTEGTTLLELSWLWAAATLSTEQALSMLHNLRMYGDVYIDIFWDYGTTSDNTEKALLWGIEHGGTVSTDPAERKEQMLSLYKVLNIIPETYWSDGPPNKEGLKESTIKSWEGVYQSEKLTNIAKEDFISLFNSFNPEEEDEG